jgi:hypothetical protein
MTMTTTTTIRCACGAKADINDDDRPGVVYCAKCWLKKYDK